MAWRMASEGLFQTTFTFDNSELELPVQDIGQAAEWYTQAFRFTDVDRPEGTAPRVILERDTVRLGLAVKARPYWLATSTKPGRNWNPTELHHQLAD
jgi:hypothetical protein